MTPLDLVRILSEVPTKRLALLDLVWELVGDNGEIDPEKAVFHAEELQLAIQEAQAARHENHKLMEELVRWCRDRTETFP